MRIFALAVLLACCLPSAAGAGPFTLLYTADERGEILPCG